MIFDQRLVEGYLGEDKAFAVALSGGSDSVSLLSLASEYAKARGIKVYSLHLNHMIREEEAERDEKFSREISEKFGATFAVGRIDVPKKAKEMGESLEDAARKARYAFFESEMSKRNIRIVMTAHNANDNVETLLIRLARGTSGEGMCGIPKARKLGNGYVIRPMLDCPKAEILKYLEEKCIPYVSDSTNEDVSYPRNRIRKNILPEFEKINPSYVKTFARSMSLLREDEAYISREVEDRLCECTTKKKIFMDGVVKNDPLIASRMILCFLQSNCACPESKHVEEILNLAKQNKDFSVSVPYCKVFAVADGKGKVKFDKRFQNEINKEYLFDFVDEENRIDFEDGSFSLNVSLRPFERTGTSDSCEINSNPDFLEVKARYTVLSNSLPEDIFARNRKPGDKIDFGDFNKSIAKLMSEKKIPKEARDLIPIIEDEEGIVLVPCLGKSKRCPERFRYSYIFEFDIYFEE